MYKAFLDDDIISSIAHKKTMENTIAKINGNDINDVSGQIVKQ